MNLHSRLFNLYTTLDAHFGHEPHWWPLFSQNTAFEVMIGAVLVQQTRWEAVEGAVRRLIERGWLSPAALAEADTAELAALIRPCAFHTQKAPGLQAISRYLLERYDGDVAALFAQERTMLRTELLALPRIGRETADAMMLYAGKHPVFIVDAYARRLFARVELLPGFDFLRAPYDVVQERIEDAVRSGGGAKKGIKGEAALLAPSPLLPSASADLHFFYWHFHELITEACIHHCLTKPRCDQTGLRRRFLDPRKCAAHCLDCDGCPLRGMCAAYQRSHAGVFAQANM